MGNGGLGKGLGDAPPRPEVLRERIRFLAQDSASVDISLHAEDRMVERDITASMMFRVLRTGQIAGAIEPGRRPGEWVVKVTGKILANRDVGVVTAVLRANRLVVITVEWEDLR